MTTLAPWIEQWQYFTSDLREQFWSDLTRRTPQLLAFTRSTGGSPAARPRRYLWLVLARPIVKGYSCARPTTAVE